MNYVSPCLFRPAPVGEVVGPAIVTPFSRPGETLLVTGGAEPFVCFLTGEYRGQGFPASGNTAWEGMAYEQMQIEVDLTSRFSPDSIDAPACSIIRTANGLQIRMRIDAGHGFKEMASVSIGGEFKAGSGTGRLGYKRWVSVIYDGERRIEIFSADADSEVES